MHTLPAAPQPGRVQASRVTQSIAQTGATTRKPPLTHIAKDGCACQLASSMRKADRCTCVLLGIEPILRREAHLTGNRKLAKFSADKGERNVLGMVGDGAMHREMI